MQLVLLRFFFGEDNKNYATELKVSRPGFEHGALAIHTNALLPELSRRYPA